MKKLQLTPEKEEEMSAAVRLLVGIALVVVAEVILQILKRQRLFDCCAKAQNISFQFFHGVQFVYEAKYLTKYNIPPMKVVGLEGKVYMK